MSTLLDRHASGRAYVPTTALAARIEFSDDLMHVSLSDGRIISVPLLWFPRLREAAPEVRARYEIGAGGRGLHWPDLVEDISVVGLLAGGDQQAA
jgi:hypothetical protein